MEHQIAQVPGSPIEKARAPKKLTSRELRGPGFRVRGFRALGWTWDLGLRVQGFRGLGFRVSG